MLVGFGARIVRKTQKKLAKIFCVQYPLWATTLNPEKVLTAQWQFRYNAALHLNPLHIHSQLQ
jgi:hypothetical protein